MSTIDRETASAKRGLFTLTVFIATVMAAKAWDAVTLPQFWAEDGTDFFRDQYGSWLPSLLLPSSGYLHVVPRLVAWLASLLPASHAPMVFCYLAILLAAMSLAAFAWRIREAVPTWISLAIIALMPISTETHATLVNLQWMLQFALLVLVVPSSRNVAVLPTGAIVTIILTLGLTGPFSILLCCAIAVTCVVSKDAGRLFANRHMWPRLAALVVTALIQLGFVLFSSNAEAEGGRLHLDHWTRLPSLLGAAIQGHMFAIHPLPAAPAMFDVLMAGLLIMLFLVAKKQKAPELWLIFIASLLALAQAALGIVKNSSVPIDLLQQVGVGDRYFIAAKVTLWVAAAAVLRSLTGPVANQAVLVGLIVATIAAPGHLRRQPLEDKEWKKHAAALEAGSREPIPINPSPWTIDLPRTQD